MKKITSALIIIIVCLGVLAVFTVFYLKGLEGSKKKNNDKEITENNEKVISKYILLNQLSEWSLDIYQNKKFDKCVEQGDDSCFISLESLENDYGKDISLFKKSGAECVLSISGLTINMDNPAEPFSIILGGCKFNNRSNNK